MDVKKFLQKFPKSYRGLAAAFIVVSGMVLSAPRFFPAAADAIIPWAIVALAFVVILSILHSNKQRRLLIEEFRRACDEERELATRQRCLDEIRHWAELAWDFVSQSPSMETRPELIALWKRMEHVTLGLFELDKLSGTFGNGFKQLVTVAASDFWAYLSSFATKEEHISGDNRDRISQTCETARRSLLALLTSIAELKSKL
jgi:hypothetical protein